MTTNHPRCTLCGGNAGSLNAAGEHNLCLARRDRGLPTPSLGERCESCAGRGYRAKSPTGPALFLAGNGPASIARAIEAWAPSCNACGGMGYIP